MSHFKHHVFFCTNQRANGDACCNDHGASELRAYVITRVAKHLTEGGEPARRLVLVGTAAGYVEGARSYETAAVVADTIVIHGDRDETVRRANVLA